LRKHTSSRVIVINGASSGGNRRTQTDFTGPVSQKVVFSFQIRNVPQEGPSQKRANESANSAVRLRLSSWEACDELQEMLPQMERKLSHL
jgi:hypothetical protein